MADRLNDSAIVGLTVPAHVGMKLEHVATPALIIELDAFERNVAQLRTFTTENDVRHRAHAKTHKSADIALFQIEHGGGLWDLLPEGLRSRSSRGRGSRRCADLESGGRREQDRPSRPPGPRCARARMRR